MSAKKKTAKSKSKLTIKDLSPAKNVKGGSKLDSTLKSNPRFSTGYA